MIRDLLLTIIAGTALGTVLGKACLWVIWLADGRARAYILGRHPTAAPAPPVDPPAPLVGTAVVNGTCRACPDTFELPAGQTVLTVVAGVWHIEAACPTCRTPWQSVGMTGDEADAMRSLGVVDGPALVDQFRLLLESDDGSWFRPPP